MLSGSADNSRKGSILFQKPDDGCKLDCFGARTKDAKNSVGRCGRGVSQVADGQADLKENMTLNFIDAEME